MAIVPWPLRLAISIALLTARAVTSYRPGDQICQYEDGTNCPLESLALSEIDGSALIYPGGNTRCAFDSFANARAEFAPNATYFFQIFPKPKSTGASTKLLISLHGGGSCVDATSCNFALQCSLRAPTFRVSATAFANVGIFNSSDPHNVFHDWHILHIPYCTGDLFLGNGRVLEGVDTGLEAMFGHPECLNLHQDMHMNGFENTKSALEWGRRNYPAVDELVISGMSAGSLGAQILSAYVAELWGISSTSSTTPYSVLADSYIGVIPTDKPAAVVLDFFGACDSDELHLSEEVRSACKAGSLTTEVLMLSLQSLRPATEWVFLNSKGDYKQRLYYQLVKDGMKAYPFPDLLPLETIYQLMNEHIEAYAAASDNIHGFFVEGEQHVFLLDPQYYNTMSITGQSFGRYLADSLASTQSPNSTEPKPTPTPTPIPTPAPTHQAC